MSMLKGYRPSSALQAILTVYKTLYELVQLYFCQKVFCIIVVPVPKFRMSKVTRALNSLFLIAIAAASVLEKDRFIIERTLGAFLLRICLAYV